VSTSAPLRTILAASLLVAACSSNEPSKPTPLDCAASTPVNLAAGQFTILDASQTACVRIPGGGTAGAEYLYAALATEGAETQNGASASYALHGSPTLTASVAPQRPPVFDRAPTAAQAFHDMLRTRERDLTARPGAAQLDRSRISASVVPVPPVVGDQRTFDVCTSTTCTNFVQSTATAKVVGQRVAIFLDDAAPAGYTQTDLDNIAQLFDAHLYPIDTTAFGRESDLDNNGVVIVLLSQHINELSPNCNTTQSVILGYFFGLDLLPSQPHSNDGEIFYGLVPGQITSGCTISKSFATQNLPGVFIHEFQHMINFNQHVLVRPGTSEDTWLNEGLSHFAEELGGRQVPDNFCQPAFAQCEDEFIGGDIDDAYQYLDDPESNFLIEPGSSSGTLPERGANWLFVRWLADHFAATQPLGTELTRALVATDKVGATNVSAVTGEDFSTLVGQWQLANYLDDLPGFTPASDRLQYSSFNFRSTYLLNFNNGVFTKPYPLTPDTALDGAYNRTGVLRAGSGRHLLVVQSAGSGEASLVLKDGGGATPVSSAVKPRIAIVRVR
jgi:hypothetical protein